MRTSAKFWAIRNLSVSVALLGLSGAVGIAASSPGALAPAGLQAEYNFAEGSGATTAGDSSGSEFLATLQNGAAFATGRIGFAASLDGVDDFVNLGDNRSLIQNASAATVALWAKPGSVIASGSFRELVSLSVGATNPTKTSRLALSLKGDGSSGGQVFLGGRATDTESQKSVTTSQGVAVGTWTHLVGVVDFQNNSLKVYVNGVVAATATGVAFASPTTANTPCRNSALGAQDDGIGNHFAGGLDQARIYNRALSNAEIQALASADELRAHWTLDDGAGLVASDASGNLHVGNLKNGLETGWVGGGQVGGALEFDGVDDFVQVDAPGLLRNVNGGAVALWIKPSSVIPSGAFRELASISVGGTASDVSRFALALRGDGTSAGDAFLGGRTSDSETQKSTTFDASLPVGVWTHLCGVVNYFQGTLDIYVNGLLATSAPVAFVQPSSANTSSPSIALGAQDTGSSNRYAGTMDAVRVYGRALTACEVQELAGRDGLEAYWKFDETSGATAADSSPTGLAATLKNGASFVPGLRGNALNLDGVDDYADLGLNLPLLKAANAGTVAAWINLGSAPPSGAFREIASIAVGGSPSNTSRLALAIKGTGAGTADLFAGGRSTDLEPQQTLTAAAGIQPGVWRHVAATLDVGHNAIRIYVDGSLIASANAAFSQPVMPTTSPANGALGAQDLGNSNWIAGKLDDVRIYCRVLSAAEIASLAASSAPAAPVLSLVEEGDQQVKLSWTSVPGVDFYNVKRSTTQGSGYVTIASPGGTNHTDLGLTNGVAYYYVVTAQNAAGEGPNSNEVAATPTAGVPPAPVIVSPASGAILNTASPVVSGTSSSSGLTITLLVDGSANGTTVSGVAGNWSMTPATPLAEGLHSLAATATNGAGTSPQSAAISIRVDTVAPTISSSQPPDGSSTTNTTPTISAGWTDPSPGSGINTASAVIKVDNVTVSASVNATGFSFTPSTLSLGSHTVSAQASDLAGNPSNLLTWSFSVVSAPQDTTPPVISNLVPSNGSLTNNSTPQLSASISDSGGSGINAASVVMALNSVVVSATVTLQDAQNGSVTFIPNFDLGEGQNTFSVSAADNAGNAASAAASFVVDRTPPELSITDPMNGFSYGSATLGLAADASDALTGMNVASTVVLLNDVDVTASIAQSPGPQNGFGIPGSVAIGGTLTPVQGETNTLRIRVFDAAGNLRESQAVFDVNVPPPAPEEVVVLTMLGGDGQNIRIGKASEPLRVRASYAGSGFPVPNLPLFYEVPQSEDVLTDIGAVGTFTDEAGEGGLRYVPSRPGPNTITVRIHGHSAVAPVVFTVNAGAVTMEDVSSPPNVCNVNFGTSEWAGSALPMLIKMKVRESGGAAVEGATVLPTVTHFDGASPPPFDMGYFMPRAGRTGPDGIATFAFVISPDLPPGTMGPFTMRFTAPEFRDGQGETIAVTLGGEVRDPSSKFPWSIDFSAGDQSGQGQIGNPGQQLSVTLKTTNSTPRTYYFVIEGTGTFQAGDTGTNFLVEDFDGCGPIDCGVNPDSDGKADVRFALGPGSTHALIGIFGATDIFAVGPPELDVLGTGPGGSWGIKNYIKKSDFQAPLPETGFRARLYAPNGLAAPPTLDVLALTAASDPLPAFPNDVAPTSRENLPLTAGEVTGRYRIYETAVLSAYPGRPALGDPVASLGGSTFQVSDRGGLLFQARAGAAEVGRHVSLVRGSAGNAVIGNAKLFFEAQPVPMSAPPRGSVDVKAVLSGVDKSAVKTISYDFGDGTTIVQEGADLLKPARHTLEFLLDAAHRRDVFRIFVSLETGSGEPDIEMIDVRAALPIGAEPAPGNARELAGLADFNWNVGEMGATPPTAFAGLAPNPFANPPPLIQGLLADGGVLPAEMPMPGRRLIYKAVFPQRDGANPNTKIFELTFFELRDRQDVYGSYVTDLAWTWSQNEFNSLVRHHEGHVRDLFDARQQTADSYGEMFRLVFQHYKNLAGINAGNTPNDVDNGPNKSLYRRFKAAFDSANPLPPNAIRANFTRAPHAFLELRPWVDQFISTDGAVRVSNRFLADSMHGMVLWFDVVIENFNALGPGVLADPKSHVRTQRTRLLSVFPELTYRKEFTREYQLPEINFK